MADPDVRFVFGPQLAEYRLADDHPFKPVRLELTRSLLEATGTLHPDQYADPRPVDDRALERIHHRDYIRVVRAVSDGNHHPDAYRYGLGTSDNPIFEGMHDAIVQICGATVAAVELVASGAALRAANFAGGLHHALADKASGFCLYNDLALGIDHAVREHGLRVAYLDVDAHHGDGVQWLFYDRAEVMTISLHESGRYLFPGTGHSYEVGRGAGRGLSVNVPLEPFTEDASFLEAFDAVVPAALAAFEPDLIVLQAGADMHRYDPLADLALSLGAMAACYRRVVDLAERHCGGRLVVTGGGGYDPYRTVPRAWALLWHALVGAEPPDRLPAAWLERWRPESPTEIPDTPLDPSDTWTPIPRREQIENHNRVVVRRVLDTLQPIWRERRKTP